MLVVVVVAAVVFTRFYFWSRTRTALRSASPPAGSRRSRAGKSRAGSAPPRVFARRRTSTWPGGKRWNRPGFRASPAQQTGVSALLLLWGFVLNKRWTGEAHAVAAWLQHNSVVEHEIVCAFYTKTSTSLCGLENVNCENVSYEALGPYQPPQQQHMAKHWKVNSSSSNNTNERTPLTCVNTLHRNQPAYEGWRTSE